MKDLLTIVCLIRSTINLEIPHIHVLTVSLLSISIILGHKSGLSFIVIYHVCERNV